MSLLMSLLMFSHACTHTHMHAELFACVCIYVFISVIIYQENAMIISHFAKTIFTCRIFLILVQSRTTKHPTKCYHGRLWDCSYEEGKFVSISLLLLIRHGDIYSRWFQFLYVSSWLNNNINNHFIIDKNNNLLNSVRYGDLLVIEGYNYLLIKEGHSDFKFLY